MPKEFLPSGSGLCFCNSCGQTFNSLKAFDAHRIGELVEALMPQRCLSVVEMQRRGMSSNEAGRWIASSPGDRSIPVRVA